MFINVYDIAGQQGTLYVFNVTKNAQFPQGGRNEFNRAHASELAACDHLGEQGKGSRISKAAIRIVRNREIMGKCEVSFYLLRLRPRRLRQQAQPSEQF